MKKFFLIIAILFIVVVGIILILGKTKIEFNVQKKPFAQSDFATHYYNSEDLLFINVWATWCAPCVAEMPMLEKLGKSHPNVRQVFISMDEDTIRLKKFLDKHSYIKSKDITLKNLKHLDKIYETIQLTAPIVSGSVLKVNSKEIPYTVLIKNKKILYKAHHGLQMELLEKAIRENQ